MPAIGTAASIFNIFSGGGRERQVQPLRFEGKIDLDGEIKETVDLGSFIIRVPGAKHLGNDNLPFYDKPLGIFNVKEKPIIKYHPLKIHVYCGDRAGDPGTGRLKVPFYFYHKLSSLEYLTNPNTGKVTKIDVAFLEPDSLPDFYEEDISDGYFDIELFKKKVIDQWVEEIIPYPGNPWRIPWKLDNCSAVKKDSTVFLRKRKVALRLTIEPYEHVDGFIPITIVKVYPTEYQWDKLSFFFPRTSVVNETSEKLNYFLYPNYPNPFNPATIIPFSVARESHVRIDVYNIIGESVAILTNKKFSAGTYEVIFNSADLNSGTYFVRAQMTRLGSKSERISFTRKILYLLNFVI